jgi:ubiquinone/menaquinone biosynthesis C-methylase UbiE
MTKHNICPWWLGYFLASPIRKFGQNPVRILEPYVKQGMTTFDVGPGMGFFTLPMARMVGASGRVIAIDIQPKMLNSLRRRATRAGLAERVETRVCSESSLGIDDLMGKIDFALTFAVLHELPDIAQTITEIHRALKPNGQLLIAEPKGHVKMPAFSETMKIVTGCGFELVDTPTVPRSHAALVKRATV